MGFHVLEFHDREAQAKIDAFRSPEGAPHRFLPADITMPILQNPFGNRLACHESPQETAYVSAHISTRIHSLYSQLAALAAASDSATQEAPEGVELNLEIAPQVFEDWPDCDHRRYHSRRLTLQNPETLPLVPSVRKFSITSRSVHDGVGNTFCIRPLSPLVPLQCIAALPNITTLALPWMWERPMPTTSPSAPVREHYSRPWEGPLRDARHDFGNAICEQQKFLRGRRIPPSLKNALLHFWKPEQIAEEDQSVARPDLIYPAQRDPVSVGLCRLAAQLERLDLRALVMEDLFPGPEDEQQWSSMQRLRIEFHPLRPDGMWYFVGPRGEDPLRSDQGFGDGREGGFQISESQDYPREHDLPVDQEIDTEYDEFPNGDSEFDFLFDLFRTEPQRERIEPLLRKFATAVTKMPRLTDAELCAYVWWMPSEKRGQEYADDPPFDTDSVHRWGVRYIAGRISGGDGDDDDDDDDKERSTTPVVQWQVGDWRPSAEIMSLFEALGTQEWLDFEFTKGRPWPDERQNQLF